MNLKPRGLLAVLAVAVPLALCGGSAWAAIQYLGDGGIPNAQGGWDLPAQGTCPADLTKTTRPECLALRFPAYASSGACTGAGPYSWSTGVCNDLINNADQPTCEAQPDRLWSNGICSVVMHGDDRNNVVCALHQGTWVTSGTCIGSWVMPDRNAYNPPLLNGAASGPVGTGDQCLRCHNSVTEYNGPRIRDVDWFLRHGHKNMARKVTVGMPWAGPGYECSNPLFTDAATCIANGGTWDRSLVIYPSDDSGNAIDWNTGTIMVNSVSRDLTWIYGDWLGALPRAIYKTDPSTSKVCSDPRGTTSNCVSVYGGTLINNAGISYSCGRCHTTGWTSDAVIGPSAGNLAKEPERSFPGITWDRNSDAGFGVVNLSGGVSGDPNKYSSWDYWGISCSRCHGSAVDNESNGGVAPYSSPTGMSSHHNDLTSPNVSTSGDRGYCTNPDFTARAQCDAVGAAWLTACSKAGVCDNPTYTTSGTCAAGGGTWTPYTSQTTCEANSGTWYGTTSCSIAGVCNDPIFTDQTTCEFNGAQWAAATDIIRCDDLGGRWTGTKTNRGQVITALCMNCHRQETGGFPYDSATPGLNLKVGPAHGTVAFVSHAHGNMFLNSTHAKFTGSFDQIATGKFNYAMTGEYKSFFMIDGEAANTGNGCTGCHDVHKSVVEEAFEPAPGQEGAIKEECTSCHTKNLNLVLHPAGGGTPLEEMATEPAEACVTCHMPEGIHLYRINVDPGYSTFPIPAALTSTVNANTAPDGTFTNAVWVDLDLACGQCHGGGTSQATATGSVASGSKVLTVDDTTGFLPNERILIPGGGALGYDDEGLGRGDFETYIMSVVPPNTINLMGGPSLDVTDATVVQNATKNGAGYINKADLAVLAKGIHNDKPYASFGYHINAFNTLTVEVDASASTCSGSASNCDAYDWNWGDGTPDGSGVTASHTYATAGPKTITLTVEEYGVGGGSVSRSVNVYAPDFPPTVGSNCSWNANTWTMTLNDTSSDDNTLNQVTVSWGDGSLLSSDTTAPFGPFTHTYLNAGSYSITHKAIDNIGQMATETACAGMAVPAYFSISGTVFAPNGTTPLGGAYIRAYRGATFVRASASLPDGTFSVNYLKPGTYTLVVTRYRYTFGPVAPITVGPSSPGNNIVSTGMVLIRQVLDSPSRFN